MKINYIVLIILSAVTLFTFSCKLDKPVIPASTGIVGTWYFVSDSLKSSQNGGPFNLSGALTFTGKNAYLQLNEDGSGVYNVGGPTNFTYTTSNNTIIYNYPAVTGTPAYSQTATIKTLTYSKLVLVFDTKTTINGVTEEDYEAQYFTK